MNNQEQAQDRAINIERTVKELKGMIAQSRYELLHQESNLIFFEKELGKALAEAKGNDNE